MGAESNTRGLILDGVIGSEHVDSSGEILDVKGGDISSLEKDGVLNYEHEGDGSGGSFNSIIGRCIKAKKIFSKDDCENARERMYWEKTQVPFIYGVFRLFDESGHPNAVAAAAIIRDQHAAKEDQILRLSIEGSTIEKQGNILKHTIARAVALTRKPCNRSAITGVLHDPKAEKSPEASAESLGELFATAKNEDPARQKLSSVPFVYTPFDAPEQQLADALDRLRKAMGAPGTQVQDNALAREDFGKASDEQRNRAKAALRDYDPHEHGTFRTYIKAQLPDACDDFIDYFSDLVDDMTVKGKLNFLRKTQTSLFGGAVEERKPARAAPTARRAPPAGFVDPKTAPVKGRVAQQLDMSRPVPMLDPSPGRLVSVPLRIAGKEKEEGYPEVIAGIKAAHAAGDPNAPALPPSETPEFQVYKRKVGKGEAYFDEKNGVLYLGNDQPPMKMYIPREDDHEYGQVIRNPHINEIHNRALDNWFALHKLARAGKLPDEVLAHSALFSAMSPNTAVPLQELAFARLQDLMGKGWDPRKYPSQKNFEKWTDEFQACSTLGLLPQYMHDHFAAHDPRQPSVWTKHGRAAVKDEKGNIKLNSVGAPRTKEDKTQPGYVKPVGLETGKVKRAFLDYPEFHPVLADAYRQFGGDARAISNYLNAKKAESIRAGNKADRAGEDDPEEVAAGFAPKTIRYLLGMAGMGNVMVPDTHYLRHTFGLMEHDPKCVALKSALWDPNNEPILQQMDRYYFQHHPAVKYTREKIKQRYGEDIGEHALFPGFWLHWLSVAPHEAMRGWNHLGHNSGTDHHVFFQAAKRVLDKYGVPYDRKLLKTEQPEQKGDVWADGGSVPARTAHAVKELEDQFGTTRAQFAYHLHMVPALLSAGLSKAERLTQSLLKAVEAKPAEPAKPQLRMFRGKAVEPGEVEFLGGPRAGWRNPLVHLDPNPHGWHIIVGDDGSHMRLAPEKAGQGYRILRTPTYRSDGIVARAVEHGLPHLANTAEQQALVNGLDFGAPELEGRGQKPVQPGFTFKHGGMARWLRSQAGQVGFVKSSAQMRSYMNDDSFSSAQREAAYHLLARNVFGLGEHVPVTAAFQHPLTGEHHSVQQQVEGGEHYQKRNDDHAAHLHHLFQSGTLDKLALMDMVLANNDRHPGNYLLTPGRGPGIHLIDNGLAFGDDKNPSYIPHFWSKAGHNAFGPDDTDFGENAWVKSRLHPEASRWIESLDPQKLRSEMERLGVPRASVEESARRLDALKKRAHGTRGQAYFSAHVPLPRRSPRPGTVDLFTMPADEMA